MRYIYEIWTCTTSPLSPMSYGLTFPSFLLISFSPPLSPICFTAILVHLLLYLFLSSLFFFPLFLVSLSHASSFLSPCLVLFCVFSVIVLILSDFVSHFTSPFLLFHFFYLSLSSSAFFLFLFPGIFLFVYFPFTSIFLLFLPSLVFPHPILALFALFPNYISLSVFSYHLFISICLFSLFFTLLSFYLSSPHYFSSSLSSPFLFYVIHLSH